MPSTRRFPRVAGGFKIRDIFIRRSNRRNEQSIDENSLSRRYVEQWRGIIVVSGQSRSDKVLPRWNTEKFKKAIVSGIYTQIGIYKFDIYTGISRRWCSSQIGGSSNHAGNSKICRRRGRIFDNSSAFDSSRGSVIIAIIKICIPQFTRFVLDTDCAVMQNRILVKLLILKYYFAISAGIRTNGGGNQDYLHRDDIVENTSARIDPGEGIELNNKSIVIAVVDPYITAVRRGGEKFCPHSRDKTIRTRSIGVGEILIIFRVECRADSTEP